MQHEKSNEKLIEHQSSSKRQLNHFMISEPKSKELDIIQKLHKRYTVIHSELFHIIQTSAELKLFHFCSLLFSLAGLII